MRFNAIIELHSIRKDENSLTIGERIKELRSSLNYSQVEFADKIHVSKQTLYKYENNIITNIPSDKIEAIADICKVSPAYIMGWVPKKDDGNSYSVPVLGHISTGYDKEAVNEVIGQIEISPSLASKGEFFGLLIKGDSMVPTLYDGDTVIVERTEDAASGDLVIATVNSSDATCKRLQKYTEGIALIPHNPMYAPIRYTNAEVDSTPVRILGKVVEMRRKF